MTLKAVIQKRYLSFKAIKSWYAGLTKPKMQDPPYKHVVQIGDPELRTPADLIPVEKITSQEVQFLIKRLKYVFEKFNCVGLSANQIGIPVQLCMIEFNKNHAKHYSRAEFANMEMAYMPRKILINPVMKILEYQKMVYPESCESVKGFHADVARFRAINVTSYDETGKISSMDMTGWNARIIQHEIDHLNGILYTDIMDRKSLTCCCWHVINERAGKVEMPYGE